MKKGSLPRCSGTCPDGVTVPIENDAVFLNLQGRSEIWVSKSRLQLKFLGLVPFSDEDGVEEMAIYDVGSIAGVEGSDLSDSSSFARMGLQWRGQASYEMTRSLSSTPPNSRLSKTFFMAAGAEVVTASYAGVGSSKRQIMNQADYFYYSGHGLHKLAMVDNYSPEDVAGYWKKDLDCVIFAGCSVLDINDYNNHFALDPEDHVASPGRKWAKTGPSVFLGYNHYAPLDSSGAPAKIASAWVSNRTSMGDVDAWMKANDNMRGRNACAIRLLQPGKIEYRYFRRDGRGWNLRSKYSEVKEEINL